MTQHMISLKKGKKKDKSNAVVDVESEYSYGTSLHLDDEILSKLKIAESAEINSEFHLMATVKVTAKSEYSDVKSVDKSITLQLTEMALEEKGEKVDQGEKLFGKDKESKTNDS